MLTDKDYTALTITSDASLLDALATIDSNQRGFVIVVDNNGFVIGTLTDGDIRRSMLRGASCDDSIALSQACRTDFTSLSSNQGIDDAIDIFKRGSIEFIPVLDDDGKLANVLLKKQLYSLLLQCQVPSLDGDLSTINENLVDFEVFNRPWGIYKTTVKEIFSESGSIKAVKTVEVEFKNGKLCEIVNSEKTLPCDMLIIAAGFVGTKKYLPDAFGAELGARNTVKTEADSFASTKCKVFTAGDMHIGQSLVVRAIAEGRKCAKEVDKFLLS